MDATHTTDGDHNSELALRCRDWLPRPMCQGPLRQKVRLRKAALFAAGATRTVYTCLGAIAGPAPAICRKQLQIKMKLISPQTNYINVVG